MAMHRLLLGGQPLQPATHGSLVGQVLGRKACLQVSLFSRDDHERHDRNRCHERDEQPEAVDPERDPEVEKREGQIDGVPAEAIGPSAYDRGGGAMARDGSASCPERSNGKEEQGDGHEGGGASEGRAHGTRNELRWPDKVDQEAEDDRAQVDKRRAHKPEVCYVRNRTGVRLIASRIACHACSLDDSSTQIQGCASPIPVPAGIVEVFGRATRRAGVRLGPIRRQDARPWEPLSLS